MRKITCLLLCLTLACFCLSGAVLAEKISLHMIEDQERMLLEGRDIFTYDSAEIHGLWLAQGFADGESIGSIGLGGDEFDSVAGLYFPFDDFLVLTLAVTSESPESLMYSLSNDQIAQQMRLPVVSVAIHETGITGPFGIQIGMSLEELMALPLCFAQHPAFDPTFPGYDDCLFAHYQEVNEQTGGMATYDVGVFIENDIVTYCHVALDWVGEVLLSLF
jgi:hypothetical protein